MSIVRSMWIKSRHNPGRTPGDKLEEPQSARAAAEFALCCLALPNNRVRRISVNTAKDHGLPNFSMKHAKSMSGPKQRVGFDVPAASRRAGSGAVRWAPAAAATACSPRAGSA